MIAIAKRASTMARTTEPRTMPAVLGPDGLCQISGGLEAADRLGGAQEALFVSDMPIIVVGRKL